MIPNKIFKIFSSAFSFSLNFFSRSKEPPSSVHQLRPGDIDVIAGLGDSLVAASGALEEFAIGTFIEARGVSWCAGGQSDWRKYFTIPNLIKVNGDLIIFIFFIQSSRVI